MEVPKKKGRPIEPEAKRHDIKVRINDKMYDNLVDYSEKHDKPKAEVIRMSLDRFLKESGYNK